MQTSECDNLMKQRSEVLCCWVHPNNQKKMALTPLSSHPFELGYVESLYLPAGARAGSYENKCYCLTRKGVKIKAESGG